MAGKNDHKTQNADYSLVQIVPGLPLRSGKRLKYYANGELQFKTFCSNFILLSMSTCPHLHENPLMVSFNKLCSDDGN